VVVGDVVVVVVVVAVGYIVDEEGFSGEILLELSVEFS
jgi:hypothetical protein